MIDILPSEKFPDILQLRKKGQLSKPDSKILERFSSSSDTASAAAGCNPFYACVISHTKTSEIQGITVAGANPQLVKYTSPADAEFLFYGECRCIKGIPATPDGKPTPAVITRAALRIQNIPFLVVDAGTEIKPSIPSVSLGLTSGGNIVQEDAMDASKTKQAFGYASALGRQLAKASGLLVIGESIPAGTTTALAVLMALGIDARFRVSSSMPDNPHNIKNKTVGNALDRSGIKTGQLKDKPIEAISLVGDPMMPSVAGLAQGALDEGANVMLAGGTQMACILAILKGLAKPMDRICIGTTSYVANDNTSDIAGLVNSVAKEVPILVSELHLSGSTKPGLQAFAKGFVKEGVGAGGVSVASMLKSNGRTTGRVLLKEIEKEYNVSIEQKRNNQANN